MLSNIIVGVVLLVMYIPGFVVTSADISQLLTNIA